MPQEYRLEWSPAGPHEITFNSLVNIARDRTPFFQRWRRRDPDFGGYLIKEKVDPGPGPWIRLNTQ
jgi:hypothetical protein